CRTRLVSDAQMLDSSSDLPQLAPKHAEHRIKRNGIATVGQGTLANLTGLTELATACRAKGLPNGVSRMIVQSCGRCHSAFLAQSNERASRCLDCNEKGRRIRRSTAQIQASFDPLEVERHPGIDVAAERIPGAWVGVA